MATVLAAMVGAIGLVAVALINRGETKRHDQDLRAHNALLTEQRRAIGRLERRANDYEDRERKCQRRLDAAEQELRRLRLLVNQGGKLE